MSTAKFNTWQNPDGTENYKCRAWVNFNGTGTVAIRAAGNVGSITDNGTGDYTVNFTNAMPDANYCAQITVKTDADNKNGARLGYTGFAADTAASVRVYTAITTDAITGAADYPGVYVAIFR